MPILDVTLVGVPLEDELRQGLAARLADAAAEAMEIEAPGRVWVRLHVHPRGDYAENGGGPPAGVQPVFVSVLEYELPRGDALGARARALADAIATACGRPHENVHILFEPPAAGRIAFGGSLRT